MKTTLITIAVVLTALPSTALGQTPSASPSESADVTVERIRPEDLPGREESSFPSVLRQTDALPRPPSLRDLQAASKRVHPLVWEAVVIQIPKPPLRPTPLLSPGHAVWMSAEDEGVRPILVTPHSWVSDVDSIWVRPAAGTTTDLPKARNRSIADISDSRSAKRFEKDAKKNGWTKVQLGTVDKHRNLATLIATEEQPLVAPAKGLELFDTESKPTSRVYGYSPTAGSGLIETRYVEPSGDLALSYYLETTFAAVLGAPIVTSDGEVVGLTVFRHPEQPERTLVVPPIALGKFVQLAQGLSDDSGPQRKTLDDE